MLGMTLFFVGLLRSFLVAVIVMDLWGWFFVPLGTPALLNYWHSYGVTLTVQFLCQRVKYEDSEGDAEEKIKKSVFATWYVLIVWGISALIHWGMV